MKDLTRFIFILCLVALLVIIQGTRFFSFNGVNPNLILIFFSGLILAPGFRDKVKPNFLIALLLFTFILESFFSAFWLIPWLVLILIMVAVYFLRGFLSGRPFLDFLLVLGLGTPLFYGLLKLISGTIFRGGFVLWETIYNLILGVIFWFCLNMLKTYDRSRT
jgi:hypothetical protein